MSASEFRPLAVLYEHPDWFRPLFEELDRRGIPYWALNVTGHRFDPGESTPPCSVLLNRMSPSAYLRGHGSAIFYTSQYLGHMASLGIRVINGWEAWQIEISKARQLSLLRSLGLPAPRSRVIHDATQATNAAEGLRFPVAVKPNIGGSGAGVRRFDTPDELSAASGMLDLGPDRTALVQEYIPAQARRIVRVEILNGHYLYAIRVYNDGGGFNLCPADVCQDVDGTALDRSACPADAPENGLRVEAYDPPTQIVRQVERIMAAAGIEVGGVEYMIDERDDTLWYYDVNALSNFVADSPRVLGFDAFTRLVDWLEDEVAAAEATGRRAYASPIAGWGSTRVALRAGR